MKQKVCSMEDTGGTSPSAMATTLTPEEKWSKFKEGVQVHALFAIICSDLFLVRILALDCSWISD